MMIEQHYDEEVLAEFLAEPRDAVARDKHLASCDLCLRSLDTLHATARTLKEPAVWGPPISTTPRPETLAFLRGVAKTMADEDATAAVWIKELLAGPREGWAARLAEHPEWRTGGMVRKLLKAGDEAINMVPVDAVEITRLAASIADTLGESTCARHLQGLANYDRAYTLWFAGSATEALECLDRASDRIRGLAAAEYDQTRVDLMRAMLYRMFERRDEAISMCAATSAVFRLYGDADRYAGARSAMALTLQGARRIHEALEIHSEMASNMALGDRWRVAANHNMAICYREIGDTSAAVSSLLTAIAGYERLGMETFRAKCRWTLAQTFAQDAQHTRALPLLFELRREFEELGMTNEVAMVSLDIAEALLATDRRGEVRQMCADAITYFAGAGLTQTEPALRGLAYLHEAASRGNLDPEAIRDVRIFILSPEAPSRLFAEPRQ